jgi:hypothetical protein
MLPVVMDDIGLRASGIDLPFNPSRAAGDDVSDQLGF